MSETTTEQPLFSVPNNQCEDSGPPPVVPEKGWRSYFENRYGEQWLFVYDKATKQLTLRGGDCGWEAVLVVRQIVGKELVRLIKAVKLEYGATGQLLFAGKPMRNTVALGGAPEPAMLFVFQEKPDGLTGMILSVEEYVWLDACLIASECEVPALTANEYTEIHKASLARGESDEEE